MKIYVILVNGRYWGGYFSKTNAQKEIDYLIRQGTCKPSDIKIWTMD